MKSKSLNWIDEVEFFQEISRISATDSFTSCMIRAPLHDLFNNPVIKNHSQMVMQLIYNVTRFSSKFSVSPIQIPVEGIIA